MLGRTLRNHYQIIKDLGEGGFGDTYLAKDLDLPGHPHCVVKHLKWCQDILHKNYNGAPTDGSAWETGGDSENRRLRGGSWLNQPLFCRSAYRGRYSAGPRDSYLGFRVAVASVSSSS